MISTVLTFALLPVGAIIFGGAAALWRVPSPAWRSAVLHFAAGVVFSVVAVELLPDIVKQHKPAEVALGFGGGVATMLAIRALVGKMEKAAEQKAAAASLPESEAAALGILPWGMLFGIGVDLVVDGLLLGIGFAAGQNEGILLALALAVEVLALGLATSAQLQQQKVSARRILAILAGLAALFLMGSIMGATLLSNVGPKPLEIVLSFGLAALLFLVTEELLVEAHEEAETAWLTASFFVGFLLFLLLGMSN